MSNGIGNLPTATSSTDALPKRVPGATLARRAPRIPTAPYRSQSMTAAQVTAAAAAAEPDEPATLGYGIPAWKTAFGS